MLLMNIAKYQTDTAPGVGIVQNESLTPLVLTDRYPTLQSILSSTNPTKTVQTLDRTDPIELSTVTLLPPIDDQEVWAAGVTYKKSQTARMEESEASASCYDKVYDADRPELFFKAVPMRVRGHHQPLRIRADATWNVPEPEITLVISNDMRIVGLTVGNDMSSRDIEGENPLYLPQAKTYDASAGLGPWVTLYDRLPPLDSITVELDIRRDGQTVFDGQTSAAEMHRQFEDLVGWLGRDVTFPHGVFLMTGTGIVPTTEFTLHPGDQVHITIGGVGTLTNSIVQGQLS